MVERAWIFVLGIACALLFVPRSARAIEYEVFVEVDDEEDLYDLLATEQISEETFGQLVDSLRRSVDLESASREEMYTLPNLSYDDVDAIIAYREAIGRIGDAKVLVAAGVLSRRKADALAPFLVASGGGAVHGRVRYRTVWTAEDRRVPPMALQARVAAWRHFVVGMAALLDRNRLAPVTWDPNRDAFVSDGPRVRPRLPKAFAIWETPRWGIVAGTYGIGFGQRLVLDTSGRYTPNGFFADDTIVRQSSLALACRESTGELTDTPCPADAMHEYVTPDYDDRERFLGVAAGAKHVPLRVGWLQAFAFVSLQNRSIYQYEVWDRDACADPRVPGDVAPECAAPAVYRRGEDLLAPAPALSYATLPNMYRELVSGGNFAWFHDTRTHVGVTGYGATVDWLVEGARLSFQDSSRMPSGGPWGAVGADASWGRAWADVFVEVAHSVDSMSSGGGGPAAIARHVAAWKRHEVEVSGRYYDGKFANPFARPISAADETDGLRARDEAGGRVRYNGSVAELLMLRAAIDVWSEVKRAVPKLRATARADVQALPWLRPGVAADYQSRDLQARGGSLCFDQGTETSEAETFGMSAAVLESGTQSCTGQRVRVTGRLRFDPHSRVHFDVQYRHAFVDDVTYADRMRQDAMAAFLLGARPIDALRLRLRLRYDDGDIRDHARLQETVWGALEIGLPIRRWLEPSLRYDVRAWLDDRESTSLRRPNPEHWIHLQVESRF